MTKRKDPLKTNVVSNKENTAAFVTFDPTKPEEAANAIENSKALNRYQAVAYGGGRDRFEDVSTNISVRNEFSRKIATKHFSPEFSWNGFKLRY